MQRLTGGLPRERHCFRDHDLALGAVRDDPEFKAVFAAIERDRAAQRAILAARR